MMPSQGTEKQKDRIFVEKKDSLITVSINEPVTFTLKDTKHNQKFLIVLLRLFKQENGRNIATFREISAFFGLNSRQDSNNFFREYQASGEDILHFLERKKKLKDALPIIEEQVIKNPLYSIHEQYKIFIKNNPELKMSEMSFRNYLSNIDAFRLKKRYDQLLTKNEYKPDISRILKEIIEDENTSQSNRKRIISVFPELQQKEKDVKKEICFMNNFNRFGKMLLVMFLIASGLNYNTLALIMGVSKSTIHNLFHSLTFLKRLILSSIKWWSGKITTDEKWIKINKKWYYVISIVDDVTGFPLYFQLVSNLKKETWVIFFQRFYKIYGKPRLIISDGSEAIAGAIKQVFPKVNHQLCKFHKLKNLKRKIYESRINNKERNKMLKQAERIFSNTTYNGRKRAAKRLIEISPENVSRYVEKSILGKWKQLTKGYTSNSAERWNRKIEKVTLGRYGLKSEKFVIQLITALWLKEAINNKVHLENCFIHDLNLKKVCQENVKMGNIIQFFRDKLLGNVA